MKKAILKVFGIAALTALMLFNVQLSDSVGSADISLAALGNVAVAQSEGDGKCYETKIVTVVAWVTTCDENGNNCETEQITVTYEVKTEVPCPFYT